MSFADSFAHQRNEMDFCGPSLSSCSSTRSTPDTSVSLTLGHSPLFFSNENLSFQVSYLIFLHVTITLILYLIRMSHLSIINVFISRCNLLMWRIPVHYSLQHRLHVNNLLSTFLLNLMSRSIHQPVFVITNWTEWEMATIQVHKWL